MNQPVPVSRRGWGETTRFSPPAPQLTMTSPATSAMTRATAGLARSSASCSDGSAARPGPGATSARKRIASARRIDGIIATKRRLQGLPPGALVRSRVLRLLLQDLDGGFGLRLRLRHVAGLARGLGLADQL